MQALRQAKWVIRPPVMTSLTGLWARTDLPLASSAFLDIGGVRHKIMRPKFTRGPRNQGEGEQEYVQKFHGFNYYPRNPGDVDPPYEPSKLFSRPYWERHIVEGFLGLADRRSVAIVKNTPEANAQLFRVKHLIEITPITFPNGMPSDPKSGFLKENGEFIVYDKLAPAGAQSMEQAQGDVDTLKRRDVDGVTLKNRLKLQWYSRW